MLGAFWGDAATNRVPSIYTRRYAPRPEGGRVVEAVLAESYTEIAQLSADETALCMLQCVEFALLLGDGVRLLEIGAPRVGGSGPGVRVLLDEAKRCAGHGGCLRANSKLLLGEFSVAARAGGAVELVQAVFASERGPLETLGTIAARLEAFVRARHPCVHDVALDACFSAAAARRRERIDDMIASENARRRE